MKTRMATLAVCFGCAVAVAQQAAPDFRSASWGMSPAQVRQLERGKANESPLGKKLVLEYSDTVAGLTCDVLYIFAEQQLVRSKYVVTTSHTNLTDYIGDYGKLQAALIEKYGKPKEDETIWKNDLYQSTPKDWGMAVAVGHLAKYSVWRTPRTQVALMLTGDNYDVDLDVEYMGIWFEEIEDRVNKEEEKGKL